MEAAIFGLGGVVIGGVITIVVAYFNNRNDLRLKQLEFEVQREELRSAERTRERERRLDKYAAFLGAYRQVQGGVVAIVLLMQDRPKACSTTIDEIADSPAFSSAVGRLNDGAAWVALLCREPRAAVLESQLSAAYDALLGELRRAKTAIAHGETIDAAAIATRQRAADSTFEDLVQLLRSETLAV